MYHHIREFVSCQVSDGTVAFHCKTNTNKLATIQLEVLNSKVIRFRMLPDRSKVKGSYINLKEHRLYGNVKTRELEDNIVIQTNDLDIRVNKSPFAVSFYNKDGALITREETSDRTVIGTFHVPPLGFLEVDGEITSIVETMMLAPDEHFYGFGEKFTSFDKRNQEIKIWNTDAYGVMSEASYKNIPFFLSTRGYGIFVNTPCKTIFRMGSKSTVSYSFEVFDNTLEYYFIYGPAFKEILNRYSELVGRPALPPKWSFGLWLSSCVSDIYKTRDPVVKLAEEFRRYDIPCDVYYMCDIWWMKYGTQCCFEWDEEAFPNPKEMIKKVKELNYRICLWEYPRVPIGTDMYREGAEKGYFLKNKKGAIYLTDPWHGSNPVAYVDFTNPKAVKWYKEKHKPLFDMGVDVMKTDDGEDIPEDAVFYNGETGARMHNLYPLLYNKAVFEATKEYTGRGLVWARSAFVGSQKYPVHWLGDPACTYPSMAACLRAGLSLGMSGFPFWSHDIGGFGTREKGKPTPDLYIRWAQFGLFSPLSRIHGIERREPWYFGKKALEIFRTYAKLRYKLLPYIYSYAFIASKTGLPIVRPLVLEYQDDPNTYGKDLEYLFGEELLVAPIFDETGERTIYLPKGKWIDYWNGKEYKGPIILAYKAPLHLLPLFIRDDSIIPTNHRDINFIPDEPFDYIDLEIFLRKEGKFMFYDDDGTVIIRARKTNRKITIDISKSKKVWLLKIHRSEIPNSVRINEREAEKCLNIGKLDEAFEGWLWESGITYVKVSSRNQIKKINVLM